MVYSFIFSPIFDKNNFFCRRGCCTLQEAILIISSYQEVYVVLFYFQAFTFPYTGLSMGQRTPKRPDRRKEKAKANLLSIFGESQICIECFACHRSKTSHEYTHTSSYSMVMEYTQASFFFNRTMLDSVKCLVPLLSHILCASPHVALHQFFVVAFCSLWVSP